MSGYRRRSVFRGRTRRLLVLGGMLTAPTKKTVRENIAQIKRHLNARMNEMKKINKERTLTTAEKAQVKHINQAGRAMEQLEKVLTSLVGARVTTKVE